jgi:hypothetical protein
MYTYTYKYVYIYIYIYKCMYIYMYIGLVDSTSSGRINMQQFYKTIRLVSLCCSPIYATRIPSLDRYIPEKEKKIEGLKSLCINISPRN